jgi:hypothetical protein
MMLSAVSCALQLGLSGAIPLRVGLTAMAGYHAVIGLAEGALTSGVLSFIAAQRPDLIRGEAIAPFRRKDWAAALILVGLPCIILALAGSSSLPDPMQRLLEGTEGESAAASLIAPERYREFVWAGSITVLILVVVFLAGRLAQKRDGGA